jgi:hypothetical protein
MRGHAFVEVFWVERQHHFQHAGIVKPEGFGTDTRCMRGSHPASLDQGFDRRQLAMRSSPFHDQTLTYLVNIWQVG